MSTVTTMLSDFQDHGFTDIDITHFLVYLNHSQQMFCAREPWPFLEKLLTSTFTASQAQQFTAITDIKQVLSLINTTQGYALDPERASTVYKDNVATLTVPGTPTWYYTPVNNAAAPMGKQVHVYPQPAAADAVQLRYIYIPTLLTAGGDIPVVPERFHRILVFGALWQAYRLEDDPQSGDEYETMFEEGIQMARNDLWDAQYDRPDYVANIMDDYGYIYY